MAAALLIVGGIAASFWRERTLQFESSGAAPAHFADALQLPQPEQPAAAPPPAASVVLDPQPIDCAAQACIALTFDDGPAPSTPAMLDVLQSHGAKATFFVLGMYAERHPEMLRRMMAEGHEIGNHGWSHRDLSKLPQAETQHEIIRTNGVIAHATGKSPTFLRPPYGNSGPAVAQAAMPIVLWSDDPKDWRDRTPDVVTARMLAATPGAIVVAHDIYPSTVEAMPHVIADFHARGYVLVTLSELLGAAPPGEYRRR